MARLILDRATKRFGDFAALDGVSLSVEEGELIGVLGPSGCGKTTLLRAIAGLEPLSDGEITLAGRVVSSPGRTVPPEERRVGIVFQSYALWPHMSVAENVGYALKVARVPAPERRRRVEDAMSLVGLGGFADRRPAELSGGQRQRVALARCLVMTPSIVLLDEPLANLDAHLRHTMEGEIADFHRRTGSTMLYITHDQAEAMALSDRIAVIDRGRLQQIATPRTLYREPASAMVARFIGEGMVIAAAIGPRGADGRSAVDVQGLSLRLRSAPSQAPDPEGCICLHPRDLAPARDGEPGLDARVRRAIYRGGHVRIEAECAGLSDTLLRLDVDEPASLRTGEPVRLVIRDGWVIPGGKAAQPA